MKETDIYATLVVNKHSCPTCRRQTFVVCSRRPETILYICYWCQMTLHDGDDHVTCARGWVTACLRHVCVCRSANTTLATLDRERGDE